MNRVITNKIFAVIICSALILLTGCGSSETNSQASDDEVSLSNIHTLNSDLSPDERKMLRDVDDCFSDAYLDSIKIHYSMVEFNLVFENTTEYDLFGYINCYVIGSDNVMIYSYSFNVNVLSGDKVALPVQFTNSSGAVMDEGSRFCFQVEFPNNSSFYRTSCFTFDLSDSIGSVNFSLVPEQSTNFVFDTFQNCSYTLDDFTVTRNDSGDHLNFLLTKTSGNVDGYESFLCRIVDDENVVVYSNTFHLFYIKSGETILYSVAGIDLSPGDYFIELSANE